MSVNINYTETTNLQKWQTLNNGEFAILEGNSQHPIPKGLYRIFVVTPDEKAFDSDISYALLPLFDAAFPANMFPYMMPNDENLPPVINKVSQVHIDVNIV